MLADVVRSGVVEARHDGAVAVVDGDGKLHGSDGDIDRPYYIRSSAKPFQARAALDAGAAFAPEQLAVACASHGAQPAHIAYVASILGEDGLDESHLRCPHDWPIARSARDRLLAAGHSRPRRIWHNCSGKHAGMLRACVASSWPTETYLEPNHPLQQLIRRELGEVCAAQLAEPGVDGCGAPVFEVTTRQLATAYAVLAHDPRYAGIHSAMARFGPLTAHSEMISGPSRAWGVVAKGGAEGCVGLAVRDRFGIALKSFDGSDRPLGPAVLDVMTQLGVAPVLTRPSYAPWFAVPLLGGGQPAGEVVSRVVLS